MYAGHDDRARLSTSEDAVREQISQAANEKLYECCVEEPVPLRGLMQPIMNFVGNLGYVAVAMSAGRIFAVQAVPSPSATSRRSSSTCANFTQPIQQLAQVIQHAAKPWLPRRSGCSNFWARKRRTSWLIRAPPCRPDRHGRPGHLRPRALWLRRRKRPSSTTFSCTVRRRPEGGHRGSHRRRQDHHGQAADALLRRGRRLPDHPGRARTCAGL